MNTIKSNPLTNSLTSSGPVDAVKNPPIKEVSLIWSGGYDSTALLIKLLEEGHKVWTHAVELINNRGQNRAEYVARNKISMLLRKRFPNSIYVANDCSIEQQVSIQHEGIVQPPLWAVIGVLAAQCQDIYFGYVRGDDLWHYKHEFFEITANVAKMLHKEVHIQFPFEWATKEELLPYYDKHQDVLEAVHTCEMGNDWRLCTCNKCKAMLKLYNQYRESHNLSKLPEPQEINVFKSVGERVGSPFVGPDAGPEEVKSEDIDCKPKI